MKEKDIGDFECECYGHANIAQRSIDSSKNKVPNKFLSAEKQANVKNPIQNYIQYFQFSSITLKFIKKSKMCDRTLTHHTLHYIYT